MILGLSLTAFTALHVLITLIEMAAGFVVLLGMFAGKRLPFWAALFIATGMLTSVTGYLFHATQVLPSHIVGLIALLALIVAALALYGNRLAGGWRGVYIASVVLALYLDVFVGVVQAFGKVALLKAMAPTQTEPPFIVVQCIVLAIFIALGLGAALRFHPKAQRRGWAGSAQIQPGI
jgi:hypothetical protein